MSRSLNPACTELKKNYDSCFNKWFAAYLPLATSPDTPKEKMEAKAREYERECGPLFTQYQKCLEAGISEKGIKDLLDQAGIDEPLRSTAEVKWPESESSDSSSQT